MSTVKLACKCGQVQGQATEVTPATGNHVVCLCRDCRAYARHLNRSDLLDEQGGTAIYQMSPRRITFSQGQDQIRCLRLSSKGLFRWYAACCKTPVGNTIGKAGMPFVGIPVTFFKFDSDRDRDAAIGPVIEKVWGQEAPGGQPADASKKASAGLAFRSMYLLGRAFVTNRDRKSPYFDPSNGAPIVEPTVLSQAERQACTLD